MNYKDYYRILSVSREATQEDIKRAYRKLARKYHPDVSKEADAEERFKELGEAYEVLKDPEKRATYDQLGAQWKEGQDFRPPPDWDVGFEFRGGGFTPGDIGEFSDFFESLFRRGFGPQAGRGEYAEFSSRGEDHFAKILIDLNEAYHGAARQVTLRLPERDAQGHVQFREHTLKVKIPKGIKQGQHIRLSGQGSAGIGGGPPGDLLLEVAFQPHAYYRVEGADVYLDLPIAPWEAALGSTVKAPTPDGPVDLKIPPGSITGRKLRLKGRGIPDRPAGDLYAVLRIVLPPADTEDAIKMYHQMEQTLAFNPRHNITI